MYYNKDSIRMQSCLSLSYTISHMMRLYSLITVPWSALDSIVQLNREGVFSSLNMTEIFPVSLITFDNLTRLFLSSVSHNSQLFSSVSHLLHSALLSYSDLMWQNLFVFCAVGDMLTVNMFCVHVRFLFYFCSLWMKKPVYISSITSEQYTKALPNQEHNITLHLCQWNK